MEEQNVKQTERMEGLQRKRTREIIMLIKKLLDTSKNCQTNNGQSLRRQTKSPSSDLY
jgi:hypothetical protein